MRTWPAIDVRGLSEPDMLQAALCDFDVVAVDERADDSWRIFFQSADGRDRAVADLAADFPDLTIEAVDVADDDWAAKSQAALRAVRIGSIIVAPPWDVPALPAAGVRTAGARTPPTVIVIQPSMGFGTGHHATTRLCLAALQQFDVKGSTVIDVGTGSGILAIASRLLGAARVIAIDDDPDAIQAARENVELNRVDIDLRVADLRTIVLARFDLVLANLTGGLILQSARRLQDLAARRGPMILSGFQRPEEASVVAAFPRLRVIDRGQEDEWVCITLQHENTFD
jgi:ribosomal protein L11 methyltransferase